MNHRRRLLLVVAIGAIGAPQTVARAAPMDMSDPVAPADARAAEINVQFAAFSPSPLDILPGETVTWTNVSERRHTVNADDGSFASGDLFGGQSFAYRFDTVGAHPFHCTVHPTMTGEVDVSRVTLGPLPVAPIPAGQPVEFDGRTADPDLPVRIERQSGSGAVTVATATPAPDGTWRVEARLSATGDYRAVTNAGTSRARRVIVMNRKVLVRVTRSGLAVTVTPSVPYGRVALQLDLRDHFGWWTTARGRLDYVSASAFRVRRPARVRVVLLDRDGWTAVATSRVVVLGRGRAGTRTEMPAGHHR